MALAIFDLDNTLLHGDSEILWWNFLARQKRVTKNGFALAREAVKQQSSGKELDIIAYVSCSLPSLLIDNKANLLALRDQYMQECIIPAIPSKTRQLLNKHRQARDFLLIITATNRFLAQPIADLLDVDDLIATELEEINNQFTGKIVGVPSFREGKVKRLLTWLETNPYDMHDSYFYSDSHHDLPLLDFVSHPVAANPLPELARLAQERGWPIISLHD
ncbi:MAG: HAD family hydrolase [Gammaproteobacteria bacterium]